MVYFWPKNGHIYKIYHFGFSGLKNSVSAGQKIFKINEIVNSSIKFTFYTRSEWPAPRHLAIKPSFAFFAKFDALIYLAIFWKIWRLLPNLAFILKFEIYCQIWHVWRNLIFIHNEKSKGPIKLDPKSDWMKTCSNKFFLLRNSLGGQNTSRKRIPTVP